MQRFKTSLFAASGILTLAFVLNVVGPKRVMAALGYTPVRDVDEPARQPFAQSFQVRLSNGQSGVFGDAGSVPAGKRLVIETISAEAFGPVGERFILRLQAPLAAIVEVYDVPLSFAFSGNGSDFFSGNQPEHIYVDPDSRIFMEVDRSGASGTAVVSGTISGHLVDLP